MDKTIYSYRTIENVRVGLVFIAHSGSNMLLAVKNIYKIIAQYSTCIHICFVTSSKIYDNNYDVRSVNCKKETCRQRMHGPIA